MEHHLGLATRTQISVYKLLFLSAGTAVSLFRAKTVQQRPLLPREVETTTLKAVDASYNKMTIFNLDPLTPLVSSSAEQLKSLLQ